MKHSIYQVCRGDEEAPYDSCSLCYFTTQEEAEKYVELELVKRPLSVVYKESLCINELHIDDCALVASQATHVHRAGHESIVKFYGNDGVLGREELEAETRAAIAECREALATIAALTE